MATPSGERPTQLTGRPGATGPKEPSLEDWLYREGYVFDFFQAVRLLERLQPKRRPVGLANPPGEEIVRFQARLSLDFPPSAIYELNRPVAGVSVPAMTVSFMGLTGPSGVLPRHYTEHLLRLERDAKGPEKRTLREWLDLFNHRFISLFYRAWEKYRFFVPFERGEYAEREPDIFTLGMFSLIGLGTPHLRGRLHVAVREPNRVEPGRTEQRVLAKIEDLSLLRYAGFLAHRPRSAVNLEAMLRAFLRLPVQVVQFQGQWLRLDLANCSAIGAQNNAMGFDVIAGDRVWDVQSKIRIRLGPLSYEQFQAFLPDRSAVPQRKALYLLSKLVRLYVGPEMDFEFQLVLRRNEVPACSLGTASEKAAAGPTSRLGWNTWSRRKPKERDAEDAVFQAEDLVWLDGNRDR